MVERVTILVQGPKELERALKELGSRAANRIARSALNRSAAPVVKRAGPRKDRPRAGTRCLTPS
jgi:hypothetical protein